MLAYDRPALVEACEEQLQCCPCPRFIFSISKPNMKSVADIRSTHRKSGQVYPTLRRTSDLVDVTVLLSNMRVQTKLYLQVIMCYDREI